MRDSLRAPGVEVRRSLAHAPVATNTQINLSGKICISENLIIAQKEDWVM